MKKVFELTWEDDLGEEWLGLNNLELCLFSKEHTKKELVKVREIGRDEKTYQERERLGDKE